MKQGQTKIQTAALTALVVWAWGSLAFAQQNNNILSIQTNLNQSTGGSVNQALQFNPSSYTNAQQPNNATSNRSFHFVPTEASKDIATKTIHFKMVDPNDPDRFVQVTHTYDPKMITNISEWRQELIAEIQERKSRFTFVKSYLALPPQATEEQVVYKLMAMEPKDEREMERAYEAHQKGASGSMSFGAYLKVYFKMPPEASAVEAMKLFRSLNEKDIAKADAKFAKENPGASDEDLELRKRRMKPEDQYNDAQKEILRLYGLKQQKVAQIAKESFKTVLSSSPHGYASQTILFGVAQGAIIFHECQKQMATNPLCAEQMLMGLKDPIGQVAFGSFIVANRFTSDMLERKYGGLATPTADFVKRAMPYLGMSAGLLMSNISAEVLTLMTTCAKVLMSDSSEAAMMAQMSGGQDPCDVAQKEFFNFHNKVEQYIPMLISMGSSTWMLVKGMAFLQGGKVLAEKAMQTDKGQKLAGSAFYKSVSKLSRPAIKVTGATLALKINPWGRIALQGMTIGAVLFQATQNWGFLTLDHSFIPFLNKAVGQTWRAHLVKSSDTYLQSIFELNQESGWDSAVNYQILTKSGKIRSQDQTGSMVTALKAFREQMEAWRMINHSKYFIALQGWTEITVNMIREMNATELFYNFYFGKVFDYYKYAEKAKTPEGLDGDEQNKDAKLAFRRFPLYGVRPTGHAACEDGKSQMWCWTQLELYMNKPDEMENFQKNTIRTEVNNVKIGIKKLKEDELSAASRQKLDQLFTQLLSPNTDTVGRALEQMNNLITSNELNDENAKVILLILRKKLGNPDPSWAQGGLMPILFEASLQDLKIFEDLAVPDSSRYNPKTYMNHMLYQMFCGPQQTDSEKITEINDGWKPKFNAPNVISARYKSLMVKLPDSVRQKDPRAQLLTSFCHPNANDLTFEDFYRSLVIEPGKKEETPVLYYLAKNLRTDIMGDWTNTNRNSGTSFLNWWNSVTKKSMVNTFAHFDKQFQTLLVGLADALNNETLTGLPQWVDDMTKWAFGFTIEVDPAGGFKWGHARRALAKSHIQEMNVYLTVLADLENSLDQKTYAAKKIKLDPKMSFLEQMVMPVFARIASQKEMIKHLSYTTNAVEGMKVVNNKAKLPVSMDEYNKAHDALVRELGAYKKHLDSLKFNKFQRPAANLAYESLEKAAVMLSVYVFNTELTNFSMTQDYQTYLQNAARAKEPMKDKKPIKQNTSLRGM